MNETLKNACGVLRASGYTCLLTDGCRIYSSTHRGVRPLLEHIDQGTDLQGFYAADKVVGRATALLYCLLGVQAVHALVISDGAVDILQLHGIAVTWDTRVPYIRNRSNTGRCPMELATQNIDDPTQALDAVRKTLVRLSQQT